MFQSSKDEWVAGLDVEYTTVLGREKDLKDEERKKPSMIQVCQDFKNFLKDKRVKFITVDFRNDGMSCVG